MVRLSNLMFVWSWDYVDGRKRHYPFSGIINGGVKEKFWQRKRLFSIHRNIGCLLEMITFFKQLRFVCNFNFMLFFTEASDFFRFQEKTMRSWKQIWQRWGLFLVHTKFFYRKWPLVENYCFLHLFIVQIWYSIFTEANVSILFQVKAMLRWKKNCDRDEDYFLSTEILHSQKMVVCWNLLHSSNYLNL